MTTYVNLLLHFAISKAEHELADAPIGARTRANVLARANIIRATVWFRVLACLATYLDWTFPVVVHVALCGMSLISANMLNEFKGEFILDFAFFFIFFWVLAIFVQAINGAFAILCSFFSRAPVAPMAVGGRDATEPAGPIAGQEAELNVPAVTLAVLEQPVQAGLGHGLPPSIEFWPATSVTPASAEAESMAIARIEEERRLGRIASFKRGSGWGLLVPEEPIPGPRQYLFFHVNSIANRSSVDGLDSDNLAGARVQFQLMELRNRFEATNVHVIA